MDISEKREIAYRINDIADELSINALTSLINVRDHDRNEGKSNGGEVFTPHWCVVDMCNMCGDKLNELDSKVLEPACGTGNILIEVLRRKLAVAMRISKTVEEFENNILRAYKSIYAVDISYYNVNDSRERVFDLVKNVWETHFPLTKGTNISESLKDTLSDILYYNIVWGDTISNRMWFTDTRYGADLCKAKADGTGEGVGVPQLVIKDWDKNDFVAINGTPLRFDVQAIFSGDGNNDEIAEEW